MRIRALARGAWAPLTVAAAVLATASAVAQTGDLQLVLGQRRCQPCPPSCVCPEPCPTPKEPGEAPRPGEAVPQAAETVAPELPALASGVQGGRGVAFGTYIDSALIRNEFRLRFDAAYKDNRPDRAEFFYAKCGCFAGSPGPPKGETRVDYQDFTAYLEGALAPRFSIFVETPWRLLNPEQNDNADGYGDMNAGFKAAIISTAEQVLTFQFRTYIPTGASTRGLGTDHVSLEPSLLLWQQISDRLYAEAELRDFIPIGGTDFAGNVLRYGVGFAYYVIGQPQLPGQHVESPLAVAPIIELVGWTVLSGKEFDAGENLVKDAAGDTIVNAKFGLRVNYGDHHSFAVSYGRALTGAVWYKDILRVEYRYAF